MKSKKYLYWLQQLLWCRLDLTEKWKLTTIMVHGFAWYYTRYSGLSIRHRVVLLASRFNTQTNYSLINLLFVFAFSYIPYVAKKKKEKEKIIPLFYWPWCQSWEMPLWTRPEVIVSRDTKTKHHEIFNILVK